MCHVCELPAPPFSPPRLRVPLLRRTIFLPGVPRLIAVVARWLPRRPVRGRTGGYYDCQWEGCGSSYAANAARYYGSNPGSPDVQNAVRAALGKAA